jgi:hypothetical protein
LRSLVEALGGSRRSSPAAALAASLAATWPRSQPPRRPPRALYERTHNRGSRGTPTRRWVRAYVWGVRFGIPVAPAGNAPELGTNPHPNHLDFWSQRPMELGGGFVPESGAFLAGVTQIPTRPPQLYSKTHRTRETDLHTTSKMSRIVRGGRSPSKKHLRVQIRLPCSSRIAVGGCGARKNNLRGESSRNPVSEMCNIITVIRMCCTITMTMTMTIVTIPPTVLTIRSSRPFLIRLRRTRVHFGAPVVVPPPHFPRPPGARLPDVCCGLRVLCFEARLPDARLPDVCPRPPMHDFQTSEAPPGAPGGHRKSGFKAEALLSKAAYITFRGGFESGLGSGAPWGRGRIQARAPTSNPRNIPGNPPRRPWGVPRAHLGGIPTGPPCRHPSPPPASRRIQAVETSTHHLIPMAPMKNTPKQHQREAKHRTCRVPRGGKGRPDSESARRKLSKSGLASRLWYT